MIKKVSIFATKNNLIYKNNTVIVALSGGPDSVFLTLALKKLQEVIPHKIICAHLNHEWRTSAIKDEQFCVDFCKKLNIPLIAQKLSNLSLEVKFNGSKEEVARLYRRHFLEKIKNEYNADAIATGHTMDDQQENFFIRLIRGASLSGLIGIKVKDKNYIRPLLETKKSEILEYLQQNSIQFTIDPTNISDDYLRNRIRNNVLPELKKADDRFDKNFFKTHESLQKTENFLDDYTKEIFASITEEKNDTITLSIKKFSELHEIIQRRIIMIWLCKSNVKFVPSSRLIEEIMRFLLSPRGGSHTLYNSWTIIKKSNTAFIKK